MSLISRIHIVKFCFLSNIHISIFCKLISLKFILITSIFVFFLVILFLLNIDKNFLFSQPLSYLFLNWVPFVCSKFFHSIQLGIIPWFFCFCFFQLKLDFLINIPRLVLFSQYLESFSKAKTGTWFYFFPASFYSLHKLFESLWSENIFILFSYMNEYVGVFTIKVQNDFALKILKIFFIVFLHTLSHIKIPVSIRFSFLVGSCFYSLETL